MKPNRYSLPEHYVTEEADYRRRRDFLKLGAAFAAAPLFGAGLGPFVEEKSALTPTSEKLITTFNNFYEFGKRIRPKTPIR